MSPSKKNFINLNFIAIQYDCNTISISLNTILIRFNILTISILSLLRIKKNSVPLHRDREQTRCINKESNMKKVNIRPP